MYKIKCILFGMLISLLSCSTIYAYENEKTVYSVSFTPVTENEMEDGSAQLDMVKPSMYHTQKPDSFPVMANFSIEERSKQLKKEIENYNITDEISPEIAGSLPTSYDPRKTGKVSHVSNQGEWGMCWVYSAISNAESSLIKQGFANSSIDLSELHAAYFDMINTDFPGTFTMFCNGGSAGLFIYHDMKQGIGPVLESKVPMQKITDNIKLSETLYHTHDFELYRTHSSVLKNDISSINAVKSLINQYGSTCMDMYLDPNYLSYAYNLSDDTSYCFPYDVSYANHEVEIVGWDDNYSASNFVREPDKNGAWLIKNSYGTNSERYGFGSGYMWVSYYDGSIDGSQCIALEFAPAGSTPYTVNLNKTNTSMHTGTTMQLSATVLPATAKDKFLTWESSDPSVASVDSNGFVVAKKNGEATITVCTRVGAAEGSCKIKVYTSVKDISVTFDEQTNKSEYSMFVGDTNWLIYGVTSGASNPKLSFSIEDNGVINATPSYSTNSITIVALKEGTATITATSTDGTNISKTVKINVVQGGIFAVKTIGSDTIRIPFTQYQFIYYKIPIQFTASEREKLETYSVYGTTTNANVAAQDYDVVFIESNGNAYVSLQVLGIGETTMTYTMDKYPNVKLTVKIIVYDDTQTPQPSSQPTNTGCTNHSYTRVIKRATSAADGSIKTICSKCNAVSSTQVINKVSEIELTDDTFVYTGKAIKPRIAVFDSKYKDLTKSFKASYSNNKKIGTGTVKITCNNTYYNVSVKRYFTIVPKNTKVKSAKRSGKAIKVTWNAQKTQTDGYEIQYSQKKNFSSAKKVKVKGSEKVEKTITGVKKKTYYVRIRTYKKVGKKTYYSNWSKAEKTK